MTARLGCCGGTYVRPATSLEGLVAQADAYPASSPRGRRARARLVYTVAAAKAVRVGNRGAYERAMAGLRGLGDEGGATLTTHGAATDAAVAAAPEIRATLQSLVGTVGGASASGAFSVASSYIGIVLGLVNVSTGIAAAAGGDANAIRVVNMIVSWIRTLLNGTAPTIPTLDANTVRGLVAFCAFKDLVTGMVTAAFGAGIAAASAAENTGGVTALTTLQAWIVGILDGICNIPQIRTAAAAASEEARAAALCARTPNSRINPTTGRCECAPGFVAGGVPDATGSYQCVPTTVGTTPPAGPIMLTVEQRRALTARPGTLTPTQQALVRPLLVTWTPGTLDPVTLCAPGEAANPCSGVCDGGDYRSLTSCVNGVPTKASSGLLVPVAVGAAALWFLFK